ncbi:unnamed protein product [Blepharisma stoltei]|uniref:VCBS repeat-containing protein n=1 Tax=Blepharisma stoltei TaxID=1481888 RepID=A0AAU9JKL8_9CILI|nr:unnamed protein product [Blepharisma stoltei]
MDIMITFLPPIIWVSSFYDSSVWPSFNSNPRLVGDINGDGAADIVGFSDNGIKVSYSTGGNFTAPTNSLGAFCKNVGGWTSQDLYPRLLGDVNGDKIADIVGFGYDAVYVSISDAYRINDATRWIYDFSYSNGGWTSFDRYPRALGDFNGDGKDDIIGFGYDSVYVSLSNGNQFLTRTIASSEFTVLAGWTTYDQTPRMVADVNGDGKADIVGFNSQGTWVALSNGVTFDKATLWSTSFGWESFNQNPRIVKDLNGDKKADIIGFGDSSTGYSLSNGSGFDNPEWLMYYFGRNSQVEGFDTFDSKPRFMADANRDGYNDIIGFGGEGVRVAVIFPNYNPNLLEVGEKSFRDSAKDAQKMIKESSYAGIFEYLAFFVLLGIGVTTFLIIVGAKKEKNAHISGARNEYVRL